MVHDCDGCNTTPVSDSECKNELSCNPEVAPVVLKDAQEPIYLIQSSAITQLHL